MADRPVTRAGSLCDPPSARSTVSADPELFDNVVNLAKRRGFVFQSAEIYGGFRSTYDYGPIGALMLRNVKDAWWRSMVQLRHDVVGIDAAILSPPAVWEASGSARTSSRTPRRVPTVRPRTASPRPGPST
jgi:hypothetical protein